MPPNQLSRPILTEAELSELLHVSLRAEKSKKRSIFWINVRTYYIFLSMVIVGVVYFWHKDFLLDLHFSNPDYKSILGEQYIKQRVWTATLTTLFYAFSYYRKWHFKIASLGIAIVASINLLNDTIAMYANADLGQSIFSISLYLNRVICIVFLFWNSIAAKNDDED